MQTMNNPLLLTTDDHQLLLSYLRGIRNQSGFDRKNAEELQDELKRAKLVKKEDFPANVVRINSRVKLKMDGKNEILELTLVTPDQADFKEKKISVLAPIGTALLGFKEGQKVKWEVPAGRKSFVIVEVVNS